MLKNAPTLAILAVHTAENKPPKVYDTGSIAAGQCTFNVETCTPYAGSSRVKLIFSRKRMRIIASIRSTVAISAEFFPT